MLSELDAVSRCVILLAATTLCSNNDVSAQSTSFAGDQTTVDDASNSPMLALLMQNQQLLQQLLHQQTQQQRSCNERQQQQQRALEQLEKQQNDIKEILNLQPQERQLQQRVFEEKQNASNEKQLQLLQRAFDQQNEREIDRSTRQEELLRRLTARCSQRSEQQDSQDAPARSGNGTATGGQNQRGSGEDAHLKGPGDCSELLARNATATSGVYAITPWNPDEPLRVFCDMETARGGWIVIQRRTGGSENFFRDWHDYEHGFGSLTSEFWLGNENLHRLTSRGTEYRIRFDMTEPAGDRRYAVYENFRVNSACDKYRATFSGFIGNAGDAFSAHNGQRFSTFDQDNDVAGEHCAGIYKGGWWYKACHCSNPNGVYGSVKYGEGINWCSWKGHNVSMKSFEIKMQPMGNCR